MSTDTQSDAPAESRPEAAAASSPEFRAEVHSFQAEVAELLHLMVHSVYSETDVFLRELISNASDACDRLRWEAIARPELLADDPGLTIRLRPDSAAGTLTVSDNGVGMDRQELVDNLGTIARSGTRAFVGKLAEAKDGSGLIGQFGVGFYAAFMVADRIEVTSRRAGSPETWMWRSTGANGFELEPADAAGAARVGRGTEIVLHLKEDAKKYLQVHEIERVVHAYSDHIQFPIILVGAGETSTGETAGDEAESAATPRQINTASAVWQRSKSELKPDDYTQAYRSICGAFDEPAVTLHYRAEGRQSYAVLLFVPSSSMFDLYDPARKSHLKLYVRRVYITDDAVLLPSWLRFVRGVVDSEDLPLNLSREMLQNNPQVAAMRKAITGKVLSELESVATKDAETFATVWESFGAVIKEGLYEEPDRREQILGLARFTSTTGTGRTLAQYVADLKENQTEIYYLAGDDLDRLKANPKLEAARARGIEVLLLTDPVDALWTSLRIDFKGKGFKSLSQGEVDFSLVPLAEVAKAESETPDDKAVDEAAVIAAVKLALGERVSDVKASQRLTDSAACLVAGGFGPDRELERLLAKQNRGSGTKPILELNMRHALVGAVAQESGAGHAEEAVDLALLLFEQAQILDGELPDDPAAFARRLNRLVTRGLPTS
ncbi:molecular chaperone HtpG [Rhodoplanes roseus]|uniref:Chaperone protein HtpG n=1 Tax=Rhodoplanes roseus TaxID=29409 RepID=A0A327L9Z8_9BRAD|nr:molecular chaperone HtpG [Rhodoplanes roseus]RAI44548.1 molecular chaperone HtpG [Rhodoplanes roseus]